MTRRPEQAQRSSGSAAIDRDDSAGRRAGTALRSFRPTSTGRTNSGFSLLEVILALAILTAMMTACLHLVRIGMQSAREARDQTRAQEIAESIMGLVTSGIVRPEDLQGNRQEIATAWGRANVGQTLTSTGTGTIGGDLDIEESEWVFSLMSEPTVDFAELLKVTVTVSEKAVSSDPIEFTLVRWIRDPTAVEALEATTTTEEP